MIVKKKGENLFRSVLSIDVQDSLKNSSRDFTFQEFPSLLYINIGDSRTEDQMNTEEFTDIVDQCVGQVKQIVIMGDADPFFRTDLDMMLGYCHELGLLTTVITTGQGVYREKNLKKYVGLVDSIYASWTNAYFCRYAAHRFIGLHVPVVPCLSINAETLPQINPRLWFGNDIFLGISGLLLLFDGPSDEYHANLDIEQKALTSFFKYINTKDFDYDIGIDSYASPWMINFLDDLDTHHLVGYESGRYSAFISSDMKMMPCTCDHGQRWVVDISNDTIENAWKSKKFEDFRNYMRYSCSTCKDRLACLGGCPARSELTYCVRPEKDLTNKKSK